MLSSVHGFALRASPAVKHGVSPPGTVGDNVGILSSIPSLHIVYALADTLVLYFADRHFSMVCMLLRIPSPTAPPPHPHLHRAASGGGAPCVTAGDTRAKRGGTRGGSGQRTLRRRRRRTESVEGVTQTCRSGLLCDTAGVGGLRCCLSTGSPFGHHPRLSMGCPRWGQWVSTLCRGGE